MNKNMFLFIIGFILLGLLTFTIITDFNSSSLATDSGFDTSYDSGGSSDWGSSSDSSYSDGSSGGGGDLFGLGENITLGVIFIVSCWFIKTSNKKTQIIVTIVLCILMFARLLLLLFVMSAILIWPVMSIITARQSKKDKLTLNVKEEDKPFLNEGYQIFYDVQMAWMNFDYNALRELVTDELYNTYYNQLQTLSVKGQRNVMSDFELVGYELVYELSKKSETGIKSITMRLNVKFYDYIVNQKGKVVRGSSKRKVDMTYVLRFIYNEEAIDACPSCGSPLKEGATICEHCNTHIHSTRSKMKLSNKRCISQR